MANARWLSCLLAAFAVPNLAYDVSADHTGSCNSDSSYSFTNGFISYHTKSSSQTCSGTAISYGASVSATHCQGLCTANEACGYAAYFGSTNVCGLFTGALNEVTSPMATDLFICSMHHARRSSAFSNNLPEGPACPRLCSRAAFF